MAADQSSDLPPSEAADAKADDDAAAPPAATRGKRIRSGMRLPRKTIGALLGLIAAIVVAAGNIEKFAGLVGKLAPAASQAVMATGMQVGWLRGYVGRGLLASLFPGQRSVTSIRGSSISTTTG